MDLAARHGYSRGRGGHMAPGLRESENGVQRLALESRQNS